MTKQEIITAIYQHFNDRDIDAILPYFHPEVEWPNGWKGGYVHGHQQVRDYWTAQWQELDPVVTPAEINILAHDQITVKVKQLVKSKTGKILTDSVVEHTYLFDDELVRQMTIEQF